MPLPPFLERFRRGPSSSTSADATPLSSSDVEVMRVRARRRLIGMVVLVGAGIVGFPWLFETKPRPMTGDIQIVAAQQAGSIAPAGGGATIAAVTAPVSTPTQATPAPEAALTSEARQAAAAHATQGRQAPAREADAEHEEFVSDAPPVKPAASKLAAVPASKPAPKPSDKPADKPADKQADKPKDKPKDKPADKPATKVAEKPADKSADKAKDKAAAKPADKERSEKSEKDKADKDKTRYVVQFGAFADAGAAHEARMKAEKLGLKTYAQQVDTPQGKRIRVRVGPFADKAEADKAAATLRKANLPGAVLTL